MDNLQPQIQIIAGPRKNSGENQQPNSVVDGMINTVLEDHEEKAPKSIFSDKFTYGRKYSDDKQS